jgi:hypothetical protein
MLVDAVNAESVIGDSPMPLGSPSEVWGTMTRAPHLGQMARLPAKNVLTLSLCPLGHENLMPISLVVPGA